jgi:hypothetical protein
MQLDGGLVPAELGPREQRQAQIDGGGVQGVGGLFQLGAERFVGVERTGLFDQHVGEIGEDAPVSPFVRVGQGAASRGLADTAVIEFGAQGAQTRFDVAQALAVGQLREPHDQELLVGGERAHPMIAAVAANALVEFVLGQFVHQLGKHRSAFVHIGSVPPISGKTPWKEAVSKRNRKIS